MQYTCVLMRYAVEVLWPVVRESGGGGADEGAPQHGLERLVAEAALSRDVVYRATAADINFPCIDRAAPGPA